MRELNTERRRPRVQTLNEEPSMTVQSDVHQADIKSIMRRHNAGAFIDLGHVDLTFRDVTEFDDFADLMRQTKAAQTAFMTLPSKLREVFDHDVNNWLDVAHDPEKLEALVPELEKRGFLKKVAPERPAAPREPAADPPDGE